jgi:hypothetical protein
MSERNRNVDAKALRNLGFPEDLIEEALRREDRGALAVEPPEDLVQRTIERCAGLFPKEGEPQEAEVPASSATRSATAAAVALPSFSSLRG